ncbi:MAG: carbonic anhydrase [Chlamydiales bacterium]
MKKLIQGILNFRRHLSEEDKARFAKLSFEQRPEVFFIGCSDSRMLPNLVTSTDPGDLFILRNIGNLIPSASSPSQDISVSAALEFSVLFLNVSHIIVCGHSECGAMQALVQDIGTHDLKLWLKHGQKALSKFRSGFVIDSALSEHNQLSQINVLQQMENIKTYSFVLDRIEKKQLRIHGWWFDIAKADVYYYEQLLNQFVLIDEKGAKRILEGL